MHYGVSACWRVTLFCSVTSWRSRVVQALGHGHAGRVCDQLHWEKAALRVPCQCIHIAAVVNFGVCSCCRQKQALVNSLFCVRSLRRMREYVPYKWCYGTLRFLGLKPKCRKRTDSTKLVPLETGGVPLVSLLPYCQCSSSLLSFSFFPCPPSPLLSTVCWSHFILVSLSQAFCASGLTGQVWLYLEATVGEGHLFSSEKNPASQYISLFFCTQQHFLKNVFHTKLEAKRSGVLCQGSRE